MLSIRQESVDDRGRLRTSLERERCARREAESIAERGMRQLYQKTQEVELLQTIAAASNEAMAPVEALRTAIHHVCSYTRWPIGHAYLLDDAHDDRLVSSSIWHLAHPEEFARFRAETEAMPLACGVGLPGRVWESREPAWIVDVTKDTNFPRARAALACGIHAGFGFPVLANGAIAAVLEFFSSRCIPPDAALLRVMASVGQQLGRVMERHLASQAMLREMAERRQLQEQLQQAQKMEAIGQLAGGVAHDFNNLLTVIIGYSEFVLGGMKSEEPARVMIHEIKRAGERAESLTRQLLAFSRREVVQPRVLDLNVVLTDMQKMLRRMIGEDIDLTIALGSSLGQVKIDPGQIDQVVMNLAVNARDAMPRGGKLTIETRNVDLDGAHLRRHADAKPGRYVALTVTDTGCGMDPATQTRIFEPFFTTKEVGKGTGLGLATVYGIVQQAEGHIEVCSEVGRGTAFKIYLPIVAAAPEPHLATHLRTVVLGNETVLLAEDEPHVRDLIMRVLREHGYTVLAASAGAEALRTAADYPGPIDLLLTDVVMPGVGGRELAERLTPARPAMRTLYLSGYTDDAVVRHGVLQAEANFLQKPFTPASLTSKVREVLDRPIFPRAR